MPNAFVETLADRLSLTPAETQQLLQDFAADLKQQLQENDTVRVPNLGIFRLEDDHVTFEVATSLAHAVNHRFAGLDPVRVPASENLVPHEEDVLQPAMADQKPSSSSENPSSESDTPSEKSGLQQSLSDSIMDKIGEKESEEEEPPPSSPNTEKPTGETEQKASYPSPSSPDDPTASDSPEEKVDDADQSKASSPAKRQDEEDPETLGDAFAGESPPEEVSSPRDEETSARDESEEIEGEDTEGTKAGAATPSSVGPDQAPEPEPMPKASPDETSDESSEEQPASEEASPSPDAPTAERDTPRRSERRGADRSGSSSVIPWIVLLLILGVIGAGAWYYFQIQPGAGPTSPQSSPNEQSSVEAGPSEAERADNSVPTYQLPSGFNAQEGGWTIIVASETSRTDAETTLRRYAELFSGTDLPLGIVEGTSDGTTRYRVGIGQFSSQSEWQAAQSRLQDRLPSGAWPHELTSQ